MSSTPIFNFDTDIIDYSIPPSPTFPPVPRVSLASSVSSLHSLYEQDGQRTPSTYQYSGSSQYQYSQQHLMTRTSSGSALFTDDDLAKAFQDRIHVSPRESPGRSGLAHEIDDPASPWKRSIRVRYSDVNMRDSNSMALQEASELLARDMASYVNSDEDNVEKGSPVGKISPAAASALLNARLQEALESMEKVSESKNEETKA